MASNGVGPRRPVTRRARGARRSMAARSGSGARRGDGEHEVGDGVRGAGPAERAGAPRTSRGARRVVEERRRVEQRRGIEVLVVDEPRRPGRDERARVGPLVAGGVRVRHDDHRQAQRRRLGERRRAGPADEQVRGRERVSHLVAQERVRPVAAAPLGRQCLAGGQGGGVAVLAGHVDDGDPLDEPRQRLGDGAR